LCGVAYPIVGHDGLVKGLGCLDYPGKSSDVVSPVSGIERPIPHLARAVDKISFWRLIVSVRHLEGSTHAGVALGRYALLFLRSVDCLT
jgi:hypothetical protein